MDRVVINIVSIAFSTSSPLMYPPQLLAPDGPDGKRRELQARAPRRAQAPPPTAASGATDSPVVSSSTLLRSVCEVGSAAALVDGHYFILPYLA
jgi:hypothetical protein